MARNSPLRVGAATSSLAGAVREPHRVHDPLLARSLVVRDGNAFLLVLTAVDLINLEGGFARELRRRVAERFGMAEHRAVIHVTHTHSAPPHHRLDHAALLAAVIDSVRRAASVARPARMALVRIDVGREFSRCRRWDSRSGAGSVTVIDNAGCDFRDGEVYVKGYVRAEFERIGHGRAHIPDDARLDGPVDGGLSFLHFIDGRGRTIAGMARFAAHVDQVAFRNGVVLSAEFPGYLCRRLKRELGGTHLFLNGPSADIKPYYREHTWKSCRRTGEGLAERLLAEMPARKDYRALKTLEVYADNLYLASRRDVSQDMASLVTQVFELRSGEALLGNLPIKKAREAYEHRWLVDTMAYIAAAFYGGDTGRMFAPRPFPMELISFNRTASYLCMPDEVFAEMTRRVRAGCRGIPDLQTVSLCNGAGWYLPPKEEIAKGGYEPTFSISAPESFDMVSRAALALVRRAARGGREVWKDEDLARQLARAGIRRGDLLLVHSAIRSCGYVEGGADAILRGLRLAVGEEGTLVLPAFTGSREDSPDNPPAFDRRHSRCWTGALPLAALALPGGIRSFHPTHSCVAIGPAAHELTKDHIDSSTPVDSRSPVQKLARQGGKILIVGLDLRCLTLVHAVEETACTPDPCFKQPCRCLLIDGGHRELRDFRLHDWSVVPPDYERYRPALEKAGAIRMLKLADAPSLLLDGLLALDVLAGEIPVCSRSVSKVRSGPGARGRRS